MGLKSPKSNSQALTKTGGIPVQVTRHCGNRMAHMSPCPSNHALIREGDKLTLKQAMKVKVSYLAMNLMNNLGHKQLSNDRKTQNHGLLLCEPSHCPDPKPSHILDS